MKVGGKAGCGPNRKSKGETGLKNEKNPKGQRRRKKKLDVSLEGKDRGTSCLPFVEKNNEN